MISDFKTKVTTQNYTFLGISISLNFRKIYCNFYEKYLASLTRSLLPCVIVLKILASKSQYN